jgi:hypothetical protein
MTPKCTRKQVIAESLRSESLFRLSLVLSKVKNYSTRRPFDKMWSELSGHVKASEHIIDFKASEGSDNHSTTPWMQQCSIVAN